MNIKSIRLIILLVTSFSCLNTFSTSVFVDQLRGEGLDASELYSVRELIKSSVVEVKNFELTDDKQSAQVTLSPTLLKLGETYFLKLAKVQDGKIQRSLKMKSTNLSDLDKVSDRLTSAILNNLNIKDTARINNVTNSEANQNTVRYQATRQWIIGFGPAWLQNVENSKSAYLFRIGYEWGLDPDFSLKLTYDFANISDSSADFSLFGLGMDYYFNQSKTSPYIGGTIGYGKADVDGCANNLIIASICQGDQKSSGWTIAGNAGVKFFRTSTVNLGLEAQYAFIFDKNIKGNPSRASLTISAYY